MGEARGSRNRGPSGGDARTHEPLVERPYLLVDGALDRDHVGEDLSRDRRVVLIDPQLLLDLRQLQV